MRLDGDIDTFNQEAFKTKLVEQMGVDQKYITIISVYSGSIVIVYDLQGDENLTQEKLLQT